MSGTWLIGACWFYCGRSTLVMEIGSVTTGLPVRHAPLYACGDCLDVLERSVEDYARAVACLPVDEDGMEVPLYVAPEAGRPERLRYRADGGCRRPRTGLGRQWWPLITGVAPESPSPGAGS
ncbi:hypothetical protein [Streptomyces sp. RFCAC02]|uniref:hypothetical protein n=1 Tax=Streptomyces sp. RFCAC02 TaxID=2499143 RepID=UPI0010210C25|nr:hypothetical protein [Streptomyces sp. RFCAC02]